MRPRREMAERREKIARRLKGGRRERELKGEKVGREREFKGDKLGKGLTGEKRERDDRRDNREGAERRRIESGLK